MQIIKSWTKIFKNSFVVFPEPFANMDPDPQDWQIFNVRWRVSLFECLVEDKIDIKRDSVKSPRVIFFSKWFLRQQLPEKVSLSHRHVLDLVQEENRRAKYIHHVNSEYNMKPKLSCPFLESLNDLLTKYKEMFEALPLCLSTAPTAFLRRIYGFLFYCSCSQSGGSGLMLSPSGSYHQELTHSTYIRTMN